MTLINFPRWICFQSKLEEWCMPRAVDLDTMLWEVNTRLVRFCVQDIFLFWKKNGNKKIFSGWKVFPTWFCSLIIPNIFSVRPGGSGLQIIRIRPKKWWETYPEELTKNSLKIKIPTTKRSYCNFPSELQALSKETFGDDLRRNPDSRPHVGI